MPLTAAPPAIYVAAGLAGTTDDYSEAEAIVQLLLTWMIWSISKTRVVAGNP